MREARSRSGAVAIGGGTGLPGVLKCLVQLGYDTSAVVTMADDGGSSGKLRIELGMLPPGDIRNCLVALADEDSSFSRLFQYRFPHGEGLAGHALGNLILAALADVTGSFPAAIEEAGKLLGVRGSVLPSTLADIALHATDAAGLPVAGQARIANSQVPVAHVRLDPADPQAYIPAVEAICSADLVVIGPGSLFTSLIPNILVPGIAAALHKTTATRVYVCNVANQRGETLGMDAADHLEALLEHGMEGALDVAIVHAADPSAKPSDAALMYDDERGEPEAVRVDSGVIARIEDRGVRVIAADVTEPTDCRRHSISKLCRALGGLTG